RRAALSWFLGVGQVFHLVPGRALEQAGRCSTFLYGHGGRDRLQRGGFLLHPFCRNDIRNALLARYVGRHWWRHVDLPHFLLLSRGTWFVVLDRQRASRIRAAIDGDLLLRLRGGTEQGKKKDEREPASHAQQPTGRRLRRAAPDRNVRHESWMAMRRRRSRQPPRHPGRRSIRCRGARG